MPPRPTTIPRLPYQRQRLAWATRSSAATQPIRRPIPCTRKWLSRQRPLREG